MTVAEEVIRPRFHANQDLPHDRQVVHVFGVNRHLRGGAGDDQVFREIFLGFNSDENASLAPDRSRIHQVASGLKLTLRDVGAEPVGNNPREFAAYIRAEGDKYARVIKASGARAD